MAKILFLCAVIGVIIAGVQLYGQLTDTTSKEQLAELEEQTKLTAELLAIQKQLLASTQASVELNQRIADIELRLARLESGPSRTELEAELEALREQLLRNTVRQDDLEYRLNDILVELQRHGVDPSPYVQRQRPREDVIVDPPPDPPSPPPIEPPDAGPLIVLEAWDSQRQRWGEDEVVLPPEDVCTTLHWRTDRIAEVFLEHVGHGPVPGTGEVGAGERVACIEASDRGAELWILHVKLTDGSWVERTLALRGN